MIDCSKQGVFIIFWMVMMLSFGSSAQTDHSASSFLAVEMRFNMGYNNPAFGYPDMPQHLTFRVNPYSYLNLTGEPADERDLNLGYTGLFGRDQQIGAGLHVQYNELGFSSQYKFKGHLNYRFDIGEKLKLRAGLSVLTFYWNHLDLEGIRNGAWDPNDPVLNNLNANNYALDFDAGIFAIYDGFFLGISYLDFANIGLNEDAKRYIWAIERLHINGGAFFAMADHFNATVSVDAESYNSTWNFTPTIMVTYKQQYFAGLSYDLRESEYTRNIGFTAGVVIFKKVNLFATYLAYPNESKFARKHWRYGISYLF